MAKDIKKSKIGIQIKNRKVAVLLYADDIVVITDNPQDLKEWLRIIGKFGIQCRCKYNTVGNIYQS